jgi:RNA recognition motif-containing protein
MNLYIGNLSQEVTNEDLQETFAQYGEVASAKVIKDNYSNLSKGFGFVEMPSNSEADTAIKTLNGTELKGNRLQISEARQRRDKGRGHNRGGFRGGGGRY